MKKVFLTLCLLVFFGGLAHCASPDKKALKQTNEAIDALQKWYNPEKGQWKTTNWWNAANVVTMIIRYSELTGSKKYLPLIDEVFERCKVTNTMQPEGHMAVVSNFINDYYDDEGWWALAWIEAYKLTKDKKYLDMAKVIFADMTTGYDNTCNGGIFWKKPGQYKNAIANSLFVLTAVRLFKEDPYTVVNGKAYANWAMEVGMWFKNSGMINEDTWLVEDGLKNDCTPNRRQNWTYNQGVPIAALCEAYELTYNQEWLDMANKIAQSAIKNMVNDEGILRERNEPNMGADGTQFKGIFIRHLAYLYEVTKKPEYKDFIVKNAESIWNNARDPKTNQLSGVWAGPFDKADASTQSSALDCLVEAMMLRK